jgi:hypothetical protein
MNELRGAGKEFSAKAATPELRSQPTANFTVPEITADPSYKQPGVPIDCDHVPLAGYLFFGPYPPLAGLPAE